MAIKSIRRYISPFIRSKNDVKALFDYNADNFCSGRQSSQNGI
jgi:hypothetical protein